MSTACKPIHILPPAANDMSSHEELSKSDELLRMDFDEFAALAGGPWVRLDEQATRPSDTGALSPPRFSPQAEDVRQAVTDDSNCDDQNEETDSMHTDDAFWEDTSTESNDTLRQSQETEEWESFEGSQEDMSHQLHCSRDLRGLEPDQGDRWICSFCLGLTDAVEKCPACRMSRDESYEVEAAGLPLPLGNILDSGQPDIKFMPVQRDIGTPWNCAYCGSGLTGIDKCFDCKVRRCVTDFIRTTDLPEPFAPCPSEYDPWQCRACGALTCTAEHCWYCDSSRAATGLSYPFMDHTPPSDNKDGGVRLPLCLNESAAMGSGSWAEIVEEDMPPLPRIATQWECACCEQWNVGPISFCDSCGQSGWHNPHQSNYRQLQEQRKLASCGLLDMEVLAPVAEWAAPGAQPEDESHGCAGEAADFEWEDMDEDGDAGGSVGMASQVGSEMAEQKERVAGQ